MQMLEEKEKRKKKLSRRRIQKYHRISSEKQSVDVQPKESKEAKDPGQPVRAAPFHAKKKIEIDTGKNTKKETEHKQKKSRLNQEQKKQGRLKFAEKKTDRILSGEPVAVKRIAQATMQSTETKEKQSDTDMISEKLTEDAMVLTESGGAFLQKEIQRGKQYSFRRKKLKKSKEYEEKESKVHFEEGASKQKKANTSKQQVNQFWKRKRQKAAYEEVQAGTRGTVQGIKGIAGTVKQVIQQIFQKHKSIVFPVAGSVLVLVLCISLLGSCSSIIQGAGSLIISTTYPSTDEAIWEVERRYSELESDLNRQINAMESRHPGYDEYRYQVDEITHNPYHLISYLTAKYGEFTYEDVKDELPALLQQQYVLETSSQTETVTETRTITVGQSLGQVVTSGYCSCSICCGQWAGGATASGVMPQANHTLAVDARNPIVPLGTKVVMNGVEYTVEDTGAFARYGVDFDVYYGNHSEAQAHGHQTWEAYLADSNGSQSVEVTQTTTKRIFNVKLTNYGFDAVAQRNLTEVQKAHYAILNQTYGNRDYLFDRNNISNSGGGFHYEIPPEALTDEKFRNMITEAEKYLGYPYVWGGASPETSFDCSGFVSYVINNCGNGWNIGRQTAEGLRNICAYVSPQDAKPGDLIFFQNTYNTSGASHVGIYVGNGMMIHCGDPIQYANINSTYWQSHFLAYGRLP